MEYNMEEFVTTLIVKHQLITDSIDKIKSTNQGENQIRLFLLAIRNLLKSESAFVLMDSAIPLKIKEFIFFNRFNYLDCDLTCLMNEIIVLLNDITTKDDTQINLLVNNYLTYQEECRKINFQENQQLLECIAYDMIVYTNLVYETLMDLDCDVLFLASTNYFLAFFPDLYQNSFFLDQTIKKIESCCNMRGFCNFVYRKKARDTRNRFYKVYSYNKNGNK